MKWRFINTGFDSPIMNMAIDEAIMTFHGKGLVQPTLRFYGWNPPAVTLGYFQKALREIDHEKCEELGIDVVRRLTGGRAVLHDEELTYSVIINESDTLMPKSITESYKVISKCLLRGLEHLDIEAQLSPVKNLKSKEFTSSACFDAPSTYELTVDGKKIVGSAQVRQMGVILQHGSILNDLNIDKLFKTIKIDNLKLKERIKSSFINKATSINHIKGSKASWEKLCEAFYLGFCEELGIDIEVGELTHEEFQLAKALAVSKYSNAEWTFRR